MNTKSVLILFLFISTLCSCNTNSKETETVEVKELDKIPKSSIKYLLPNDEFREKVLSKLSNPKDIAVLDSVTRQLDKQNLSFCQFVKRMFEIDDSCYAIAKQRFPDPSQQTDFSKEHSKNLKILELRYLKTIGFTHRFSEIATTVYAFNQDARNLCGQF